MAAVPMPKTSVHEDHGPVLWQDNIRLAEQTLRMQPESKPHRMKASPYHEFGLGVLAPDPGHHPASSLLVDYVRQRAWS